MRPTAYWEKIASSGVNILIAGLFFLPILLVSRDILFLKWSLVAIFFLYEMICFLSPGRRDVGMIAIGSSWKRNPSFGRYLIYNLLYSLSFSTILIYWIFPFDLLIANLLLLQLPSVIITGTTLHGFLSGMETVKKDI